MYEIHTNTVPPSKNPIASSEYSDIAKRIAYFFADRSEYQMDHPELHAGEWYEVRDSDDGEVFWHFEFGPKSVYGAALLTK